MKTSSTKHLRRTILIVGEIVRAGLWIPLIIALIPLTLAFHLTVPMVAATERTIARAAGAKAPLSKSVAMDRVT